MPQLICRVHVIYGSFELGIIFENLRIAIISSREESSNIQIVFTAPCVRHGFAMKVTRRMESVMVLPQRSFGAKKEENV